MPLPEIPTVAPVELARHVTLADCWVVIHGVVYDVTPLLADHPGGRVLGDTCGTDATEAFESRSMGSKTPHSAYARAAMGGMVVGVLDGQAVKTRFTADQRGRSRVVGALPSSHITPSRAVDLEVGHAIGADANVWIGLTHGVKGWFDVSFGHATLTGESDFALRGRIGNKVVSGSLIVGGGFRFQGVPDGDGPGVYAEAVLAARPAGEWVEIGLVPGIAILPASDDPLHTELGATVSVRPVALLSIYGEVREDLLDLGVPNWGAGVRFHTYAHTFTLGASSAPALAPLERIAAPEGGFSVQLALTRQFGPRVKRAK